MLEHGFIGRIIHRQDLLTEIARFIDKRHEELPSPVVGILLPEVRDSFAAPAVSCYSMDMSGKPSSIAERFAVPPEPFCRGQWLVPRFTRKDAQVLLRAGIIPEDASTELLNGLIVLKDRSARGEDPTMIGQEHRICVERLSALRARIDGAGRHVESQQPLVCSETHVPEPDFMVLRGRLEDYGDLPAAADAFCVLEVADASYERDAGEKLTAYAQAGVAQYIIINLRNRTAEIYTAPDRSAGTYPPPRLIDAAGDLPLRVSENEFLPVPLRDLLP